MLSLPSVGYATTLFDFFKEAEFETVELSPTGEYLAAVVPLSDRSVLAIVRISDMKTAGVFKPEKEAFIGDFQWISDKRVIFNTAKKFGRLERPYELPGIWGMDFNGENKKKFSENTWVLNSLPDDDNNVLVQYYDSAYKTTYGLQDVYTGKLTPSKQVSPVKKTELEAGGYISDAKGNVLVFVAGREGTEEEIYFFRNKSDEPWVQVYDTGESKEDIDFMGFAKDNNSVFFSKESNSGGPNSVIAIDMHTHEVSLIHKDDNVSPYGVLKSPLDGGVYAVRYLDGKPRYEYLQPDSVFADDHRKLRNSFPGQDVLPAGYVKDGSKAIYYVWSDRNSGEYYLFDRNGGKADYLASDMRWLDPEDMVETKPLTFKARDGLAIEAFLTMPKNGKKNLPVIINPHGGPFGVFDNWGFSSETQVLAMKGYAVLQVNFRGSGNYGKRFEEAGYKQWGRAMQDDLTDATRWIIDQGIADPKRICIYGASYGAYAAMMGVAREPELYACAIGYVGVYDLPKVVKDNSKGAMRRYSQGWWSKKFLLETMGVEGLEQISPVNLASSIKVPVFLGGGELDTTAPIAQTKLMNKALVDAGNKPEMKIYLNEGHGNFLNVNRQDWAIRVLEFLDKNIGPKSGH